jgi:hypothetical protein
MSEPTPIERMSAYHASQDPDVKRKEKLAAMFKPNERSERLLKIRETDPAAFARFGPQVLMDVGHYKQQRDAANYKGDDHDDAA